MMDFRSFGVALKRAKDSLIGHHSVKVGLSKRNKHLVLNDNKLRSCPLT